MKKHHFYCIFSFVFSMATSSCSTNDDAPELSDKYLIANVNGLEFNSDNKAASITFTREIDPTGRINLFVSAISKDGDAIEFMLENYQGVGKYYFGNNLYNNSWLKYEKASNSEQWLVAPRGAMNLQSNFIEIIYSEDNIIEGKFSCKELKNEFEDIFGVVDGTFRLR